MIRRPPRSTLDRSSAASDVYKRQLLRLQAGRRTAARRDLAGAARQAAALHGAGLSGRASGDPDDAQQQGRPQEAAEAAGAALLGRDLSLIHISEPTRLLSISY